MKDRDHITANAIELLLLNQLGIRAAVEEVSLWISQRGSTNTHTNVMTILENLDCHLEAISQSIATLRE